MKKRVKICKYMSQKIKSILSKPKFENKIVEIFLFCYVNSKKTEILVDFSFFL